jgi:hypothetical protein
VLPKTCSSRDTARHLTRNRTTEQAHKANPVVLLGPSTHSTALLRLRAAACLPTHVLRAYSWTFAKLHSSPVLSATRSAALIRRLCRSLSAFATVELHDNLRAKDDSQSGKGEQHPRSARARPGLLAWVLLKAAEELQRGVGLSREGFDSSIKLVEAGATPDFIFEGRVGIPTLESRNKGLEIGFPTPSEPV